MLNFDLQILLIDLIKGLVLALLFFQITQTNDTTVENIVKYIFYYMIIINTGRLTNVDTNIITNAFVTKTIFTLVDERVRRKNNYDKENVNENNTLSVLNAINSR